MDENNNDKEKITLIFVAIEELTVSIVKEYIKLISDKLNSNYEFSLYENIEEAIDSI